MPEQSDRTIGRSFRLREQWLNILEEEAENERISPNALLNRILGDYCLFYRHLKKLPVLVIGQENFSNIIGEWQKEKLIAYREQLGTENAKEIFGLLGLKFDKENIIFYLKEILGHYANWYVYSHHVIGDREAFYFRHNLGENWSIFVLEAILPLLEACSNQPIKNEYTKNSVSLEVALNRLPCTK